MLRFAIWVSQSKVGFGFQDGDPILITFSEPVQVAVSALGSCVIVAPVRCTWLLSGWHWTNWFAGTFCKVCVCVCVCLFVCSCNRMTESPAQAKLIPSNPANEIVPLAHCAQSDVCGPQQFSRKPCSQWFTMSEITVRTLLLSPVTALQPGTDYAVKAWVTSSM